MEVAQFYGFCRVSFCHENWPYHFLFIISFVYLPYEEEYAAIYHPANDNHNISFASKIFFRSLRTIFSDKLLCRSFFLESRISVSIFHSNYVAIHFQLCDSTPQCTPRNKPNLFSLPPSSQIKILALQDFLILKSDAGIITKSIFAFMFFPWHESEGWKIKNPSQRFHRVIKFD